MLSRDLDTLADLWTERALAAIAEAREATPGEHTGTVDLYTYITEAEFEAAGGKARYGVGWVTHSLLVGHVVVRLRDLGYDARLVPFMDALGEPTNIHEPTAKERMGQ